MQLLTDLQTQKLLSNGRVNQTKRAHQQKCVDFIPIVKLKAGEINAFWLLTELDPEKENYAFGMHDLGIGFPLLGWVDLRNLHLKFNRERVRVFREIGFRTKDPLSFWFRRSRLYKHQLIAFSERDIIPQLCRLKRQCIP